MSEINEHKTVKSLQLYLSSYKFHHLVTNLWLEDILTKMRGLSK